MNETISNKQGISLLVMFILASNLILGISAEAKKDAWLALILGFIITIPILWIYSKLLKLYPGNDIYQLCHIAFGKALATFFSLFFVWFSLHLGAMVLFDFDIYIDMVGLNNTPDLVASIMILGICIIGGKLGTRVLGRWADFFINIIFILIILIPLFSLQDMKVLNIRPMLQQGLKPVLNGAVSAFAFPFGETIIFMPIIAMLQDKKSYFKVYFIGVSIGALLLLIVTLTNILVLGPYLLSINYFPTYITVSLISLGDFFQRIQILVSILFLLCGFIEICICLISASKGISRIFNLKDYKLLLIPCAILIINLSYFVFDSPIDFFRPLKGFNHYYKIFIEAILPLVILIAIKLKTNHTKKDISK